MQPSLELREVIVRLYESMTSGDASAVERLFSRQSGVLVVGTDPNEWWVGYDTYARLFKAQLQEMAGIRIEAGELEAYVEGTVGWVADRPTIRLPNGREMKFRQTSVLHQEDGAWKIVQHHTSIGVSNVEAIGKELPTR